MPHSEPHFSQHCTADECLIDFAISVDLAGNAICVTQDACAGGKRSGLPQLLHRGRDWVEIVSDFEALMHGCTKVAVLSADRLT